MFWFDKVLWNVVCGFVYDFLFVVNDVIGDFVDM